jgi:hypothetical protein
MDPSCISSFATSCPKFDLPEGYQLDLEGCDFDTFRAVSSRIWTVFTLFGAPCVPPHGGLFLLFLPNLYGSNWVRNVFWNGIYEIRPFGTFCKWCPNWSNTAHSEFIWSARFLTKSCRILAEQSWQNCYAMCRYDAQLNLKVGRGKLNRIWHIIFPNMVERCAYPILTSIDVHRIIRYNLIWCTSYRSGTNLAGCNAFLIQFGCYICYSTLFDVHRRCKAVWIVTISSNWLE